MALEEGTCHRWARRNPRRFSSSEPIRAKNLVGVSDHNVTIEILQARSEYFEQVIALHRREKQRLGMMPRGAFEEYAAESKILIAVDAQQQCVGYVLYRLSSGRAMIVHLCAHSDARGKGIGRILIERLKAETKHLEGIGLSCRRDYGLESFWQECGFHPVGERAGRGAEGVKLTIWWHGHGHPTLFSVAAEQVDDDRLQVVLDANVFFHLFEDTESDRREESKALLSDWLSDSIELSLTPEIHNEINRAKDENRRQRSRENVFRFRMLDVKAETVSRLLADLSSRFAFDQDEQDQSDVRQLANAVAAGAEYFVTHDVRLRDMTEGIYSTHGLTLVSPADLINRLDTLRRQRDYQPAKLAGSNIEVMLVRAEHEEKAIDALQCPGTGETRSEFVTKFRRFLSQPDGYASRVVTNDGAVVALIVSVRSDSEIALPMFRVARGDLGPTLARHLLEDTLQQAARERRCVVRVSERHISPAIAAALNKSGFWPLTNGAVKIAHNVGTSMTSLRTTILSAAKRLGPDFEPQTRVLEQLFAKYVADPSASVAAEIEHVLWPARIADAPLPTFVVPIWPVWAAEFFHTKSADSLLFGVRKEIRFNAEGVYYRANQPCGLSAPGRILWYVSKGLDQHFPGSQTVAACSRLDEVIVGKPKELYRRFRRLGVYAWKHVLETAEGDVNREIMALRFSQTEAFSCEVPRDTLAALDIAQPIVSPRPVNPRQFAAIHQYGAGSSA